MTALILKAYDQACEQSRPMYIYCTAVKWVISPSKPPFNRQHYTVNTDKSVQYCEWNGALGQWQEREVVTA